MQHLKEKKLKNNSNLLMNLTIISFFIGSIFATNYYIEYKHKKVEELVLKEKEIERQQQNLAHAEKIIIPLSKCASKILAYQKLIVRKGMIEGRLNYDNNLKAASDIFCVSNALSFLYYTRKISIHEKEFNLKEKDLESIFAKANNEFEQEMNQNTINGSISSEYIKKQANGCSENGVKDGKLAYQVMLENSEIIEGKRHGVSSQEMCDLTSTNSPFNQRNNGS